MRATLTVKLAKSVVVPRGCVYIGSEVRGDTVLVELDFEYDYEPFSNPLDPVFEHYGDVMRTSPSGEISFERNVVCISIPGRSSKPKEQ